MIIVYAIAFAMFSTAFVTKSYMFATCSKNAQPSYLSCPVVLLFWHLFYIYFVMNKLSCLFKSAITLCEIDINDSVIVFLYLNIVSIAFLDFELSDAQYVHALSIEHLVPGLSDLKVQICSTDMTEACFWKIYFVLLHSKLNKQDAELLSTPQVIS